MRRAGTRTITESEAAGTVHIERTAPEANPPKRERRAQAFTRRAGRAPITWQALKEPGKWFQIEVRPKPAESQSEVLVDVVMKSEHWCTVNNKVIKSVPGIMTPPMVVASVALNKFGKPSGYDLTPGKDPLRHEYFLSLIPTGFLKEEYVEDNPDWTERERLDAEAARFRALAMEATAFEFEDAMRVFLRWLAYEMFMHPEVQVTRKQSIVAMIIRENRTEVRRGSSKAEEVVVNLPEGALAFVFDTVRNEYMLVERGGERLREPLSVNVTTELPFVGGVSFRELCFREFLDGEFSGRQRVFNHFFRTQLTNPTAKEDKDATGLNWHLPKFHYTRCMSCRQGGECTAPRPCREDHCEACQKGLACPQPQPCEETESSKFNIASGIGFAFADKDLKPENLPKRLSTIRATSDMMMRAATDAEAEACLQHMLYNGAPPPNLGDGQPVPMPTKTFKHRRIALYDATGKNEIMPKVYRMPSQGGDWSANPFGVGSVVCCEFKVGASSVWNGSVKHVGSRIDFGNKIQIICARDLGGSGRRLDAYEEMPGEEAYSADFRSGGRVVFEHDDEHPADTLDMIKTQCERDALTAQ